MKKLLPLIVALLISNTLLGQLPLTGLVAWYPFCNSINDESPTDTFDVYSLLPGGATSTSDRFTVPNTAEQFNGATNSLYISSPFFYDVSFSANDFTYSCWINPSAPQYSIIWFNGDPSEDGYGLYMNNGSLGMLGLGTGTAGVDVDLVFGGGLGIFLVTPISMGVWHHLVLTRNGGVFTLYVDEISSGNLITTGSTIFTTPVITDQFTIGQDYTNGHSAFNGKIDDLAIYNVDLVSLSSADTTQLDNFDPDVPLFTFGNSGSDTTICSDTLILIPTLAYDTSYSYLWNTGSTATSDTVTPPVSPGADYSLTVTRLYGCSYTANINVSHLNVSVNIGPRDTTFCTDVSFTLNASGAGETYLWSTGSTAASIPAGTSGPGIYTYWVVVDSADGCTGTDTTAITVDSEVIVTLRDTTTCNGAPVVMYSYSGHGAGTTYLWGGLPAPGGVTTNPTYTVTATGNYWLTVTIGKCSGADTAKVNVVFDTVSLLTPDTAICAPGSIQIRGTGNPSASFQWTPTAGLASANSINPLITPDTSAMYTVTATLFGCAVSDSLYIDVQPKPSVYIGGNRSVCKGDTIHITATVTPSWYTHYIYNWSPGSNLDDSATTIGDSVVSTVVFTAGDSTDLIIIVKTPLDSTGRACRAVDSAEIIVHTPHATVLTDTSICPGDSLILNPNPVSENGVKDSYAWHPGIYLSDSNAVQPVAKPITTVSYWVQSTDQYGCFDTATENIIVYPGAVIYLSDSATLYPGETYQLSPQTNCLFFSWWPPLGLSDTSIANPVASPSVNTKYIVHATTEYGCAVTDSIDIDVDPTSIVAVPNAFTPGASVNNYLYVLKRGIVTLNYFRIFNRWGNKVYESNNIDAGWDGTYNGMPEPFDVYVYDLQATTNEGVIFQKTGNITLIR